MEDADDSWCECGAAAQRRQGDGDDNRDIFAAVATPFFQKERTLTKSDDSSFLVSRASIDSLRSLWKDERMAIHDEPAAATENEAVLLVRYGGGVSAVATATTASYIDTTSPEEFLKDFCPSLKVWQGNNLAPKEDACLLVAPSEESYHVYRWEQQEAATIHDNNSRGPAYRPVPRLPSNHQANPEDDAGDDPLQSFYWTRQFTIIREQVARELEQVLSKKSHHSTKNSWRLLVVVDKHIANDEIAAILASICPEDRAKILLWCLDAESHAIVTQQQYLSQSSSYYNAAWHDAAQERLPNLVHLVAEVLAVQQLVLLGYHVMVKRRSIGSTTANGPSLSGSITIDWRNIQADVVTFWSTPTTLTGRKSLFEAPMCLIKSNVRTKALWSKLLVSLDLVTKQGVDSLDEIVSNYASLFGMHLAAITIERAAVDQILKECT